MSSITVSVPEAVLEAARRSAVRAGVPVDALITQVIEQAFPPAGVNGMAEMFRIADEINKKGCRAWKREDLYDG